MGFVGRWFSERDMLLVNSFNHELLNDMVQTVVSVFKISVDETITNVYGETSPATGKVFYPGVDLITWVDRADIVTESENFGPDRKQSVVFKFMEIDLKNVNLFPEVGDIVLFNSRYHEIDNVVQEQFLGGVSDKSLSIIVNTHYSRLSKLSLVERQI